MGSVEGLDGCVVPAVHPEKVLQATGRSGLCAIPGQAVGQLVELALNIQASQGGYQVCHDTAVLTYLNRSRAGM